MSPRLYNYITSGCVLVAVLAALFFESAGKSSWILGLLGIAAGITATVTYFCNQFSRQAQNGDVHRDVDSDVLKLSERLKEVANTGYVDMSALTSTDVVVADTWNGLSLKDTRLYSSYVIQAGYVDRQDPFVDQVVQIVSKLCAADHGPSYEFVINRDGSFLIRETKSQRWTESTPLEEEVETVPEPPLIH